MTSLDVTLDPVPNRARLIYVWRKRTEEEEGAKLKENVLFIYLFIFFLTFFLFSLKRTIYEIKALSHCDLHRLFGQKLHHNWEGREESFAALLLTTRFEHLMFARLNCYRIPEIFFVPPVFFLIRKRSTVQNGPFCKPIFSGMRLRLVLTLEQATNKNVLSGLFRCYSNFLILTCSPITGLHPDS